ncbi:hypothetical protein YTPLAS72_00630 [Nitrospira sp.]|nr:hypothetical protein YTPLAS72_00630 [Nitrospira sp.]
MASKILESREEVTRAIICAIKTRPNLSMDDLILCCRPYTWNQVFLPLDDLTRTGAVRLKHKGGFYMISSQPPMQATGTVSG